MSDSTVTERSWEGAAHEYEEQARFARAERDVALARIAELETERNRLRFACEVISNGETSSPIDMANAALENGDTLRWLDRLSIGEAYAYRSEDHGPRKKP